MKTDIMLFWSWGCCRTLSNPFMIVSYYSPLVIKSFLFEILKKNRLTLLLWDSTWIQMSLHRHRYVEWNLKNYFDEEPNCEKEGVRRLSETCGVDFIPGGGGVPVRSRLLWARGPVSGWSVSVLAADVRFTCILCFIRMSEKYFMYRV